MNKAIKNLQPEDFEDKIKDIPFKEKLSRSRHFFKTAESKIRADYKKLPQRLRRLILIGIIAGYPSLMGPPKSPAHDKTSKHDIELLPTQANKQEALMIYNEKIKAALEKKYVISDRKTFDELYQAALPLIQVSLFSIESCALEPYSDNRGPVLNTRCIGLFYCPENDDPSSKRWIKTSTYVARNGPKEDSVDFSFRCIDGWYSCLDNGAACNQMYNLLKGAELNVHEFAAIAMIRFGNTNKGNNLCRFVHEHYDDRVSCAKKIAQFSVPSNFPGLAKRWVHAACLYLNENNYVQQIYQFKTKMINLKHGGDAYSASVTHLNEKDILALKTALNSGNLAIIAREQKRILRSSQGNLTIAGVVRQEISDKAYRNNILRYCFKEDKAADLEDIMPATKTILPDTQQHNEKVTYDMRNFIQKNRTERSI